MVFPLYLDILHHKHIARTVSYNDRSLITGEGRRRLSLDDSIDIAFVIWKQELKGEWRWQTTIGQIVILISLLPLALLAITRLLSPFISQVLHTSRDWDLLHFFMSFLELLWKQHRRSTEQQLCTQSGLVYMGTARLLWCWPRSRVSPTLQLALVFMSKALKNFLCNVCGTLEGHTSPTYRQNTIHGTVHPRRNNLHWGDY